MEGAAATTFGSWFNHVAAIDVVVTWSNANKGTLATAGSAFPSSGFKGFGNREIVSSKVLGFGDVNGSVADANVKVNFFTTTRWGIKVGVLRDLGDDVVTVPETSGALYALVVMWGMLLLRRR